MCDHCKTKKCISGIRYSCKVRTRRVVDEKECDDYDLCESCFQHAREFHPHHAFLAYDPPQPDVFGILRDGKGREVEAPMIESKETDKGAEEVKEVEKKEVKEVEKKEVKEVEKEVEKEVKEEVKEVKEKMKEEVEKKEEKNTVDSSFTPDSSWTVVGEKRRKNRSASISENKKEKKREQKSAGKQDYRRTTSPLPTKPVEPALARKEKSESGPQPPTELKTEKSEPVAQASTEPKAEKAVGQPLPLPAVQPPFEYSGVMNQGLPPLNNDAFKSPYNPPLSMNQSDARAMGLDHFYDYHDENMNDYTNMESQWWPKPEYGMWRQRKVSIERDPWLFEHTGRWNDYFEDDSQPIATVPYTSDELQVGSGFEGEL